MKITPNLPTIQGTPPSLPPAAQRHAAMTSHVTHLLGGAAPTPNTSKVGATQQSQASLNTDATLQAWLDISQIYMLYQQNPPNTQAVDSLVADLFNLLNKNPNLYAQTVSVTLPNTGVPVTVNFNPRDIVNTVFNIYLNPSPQAQQAAFMNLFLNGDASHPPLDECLYALISPYNTDSNFDFSFSSPQNGWKPSQLMDVASCYMIMAALSSTPEMEKLDVNIDKFWSFCGSLGPNSLVFSQFLMTALILQNSTLNPDGSIASTNWTQVNSELALIKSELPAPTTPAPNPDPQANYRKMYNQFQGLSCNYQSLSAAWTAVGLPADTDYNTIRGYAVQAWDAFLTNDNK
jgi:hypothetical protein